MRASPFVALTLSMSAVLAGCALSEQDPAAADDPSAAESVTEATTYPGELYGFVSTEARPANVAGWDYNRCVPDPIGQVNRLRQRGDVVGFNMGAGYPDVNGTSDHWQGVQRLGVGNRRYFALGSRTDEDAHLALVSMGSRNTTGGRIRGNRMSTVTQDWNDRPSALDAIVHDTVMNPTFVHPGGMQALGRYLFVPLEQGGGPARVYNYDFGDVAEPLACNAATGAGCPKKQWGFVFATDQAAVAATAKLRDGRYLLLTARADSNVLEFYLSKPGYHISQPDVFGAPAEWGNFEALFDRGSYPDFRSYYQNMNVVTACPGPGYETGQLYLLGTTKAGNTDVVDLFEMSIAPGADPAHAGTDHTVHMRRVASRTLYCTAVSSGRQCDFDAAAGAYVDPDGRLLVYAAEHDNDGPGGSVKMMEFRPTDHLDAPDTSAREGCPTIDKAFVELYDGPLGSGSGATASPPTTQNGVLVEYTDRWRRNYGHFDTAYGLNDDIQSIRYCIPPGYKYRVFSDSNHSTSSSTIHTFRGDGLVSGQGEPSQGAIRGYNWSADYNWSSGCFMTTNGNTCL